MPPEVVVSQFLQEVWELELVLALVLRRPELPLPHLEPRLQAPQDRLRLLRILELHPRTLVLSALQSLQLHSSPWHFRFVVFRRPSHDIICKDHLAGRLAEVSTALVMVAFTLGKVLNLDAFATLTWLNLIDW